MTNQTKIVLAITVIIATGLITLNPSLLGNADAQIYDNQYGYDNNYNNYYPEPKSSHTDIQKIQCVNSNINVNGVDITQIPQEPNDLAATAATNEEGLNGEQNGLGDIINFERNLVNVCANVNANEQEVSPREATLSVSKTVSCEPLITSDPLPAEVCRSILTGNPTPSFQITPDEFSIQVTGNNPNPSQFDGSTTPVDVTLSADNYQVTEAEKASVQQTIDAIESTPPTDGIVINPFGPKVTFSGHCTKSNDFEATGTIAEGQSQICNIDNKFEVDLP